MTNKYITASYLSDEGKNGIYALGILEINIYGNCLTQTRHKITEETRQYTIVPLFFLAEWFVSNWFSLFFDRYAHSIEMLYMSLANECKHHTMAGIYEGRVPYPNCAIFYDGLHADYDGSDADYNRLLIAQGYTKSEQYHLIEYTFVPKNIKYYWVDRRQFIKEVAEIIKLVVAMNDESERFLALSHRWDEVKSLMDIEI